MYVHVYINTIQNLFQSSLNNDPSPNKLLNKRWPVQIVLITFVVKEIQTDFCLQLGLYVPKSMNSF